MVEALLLSLWVGTSLFFICREIKTKEDRERQEYWLSELRECLHSIENEFLRRCYEITEKALSQHNFSYALYLTNITELEDEYINEVYNKVVARKRIPVNTLPEYLVKEYERNISEIADIYRNVVSINK